MLLSIHIILPRCCKQWLQCERSLHWWVVILLGLLLHAQLELSLHHLLPYGLSANAHVSWRRVLRTPPHLPFLGRGVPQESNDLGVWTWLSSRSALTPDLEPFLILFLRCPSFWHYLLSLVFEAPLVLPPQRNAGFDTCVRGHGALGAATQLHVLLAACSNRFGSSAGLSSWP